MNFLDLKPPERPPPTRDVRIIASWFLLAAGTMLLVCSMQQGSGADRPSKQYTVSVEGRELPAGGRAHAVSPIVLTACALLAAGFGLLGRARADGKLISVGFACTGVILHVTFMQRGVYAGLQAPQTVGAFVGIQVAAGLLASMLAPAGAPPATAVSAGTRQDGHAKAD